MNRQSESKTLGMDFNTILSSIQACKSAEKNSCHKSNGTHCSPNISNFGAVPQSMQESGGSEECVTFKKGFGTTITSGGGGTETFPEFGSFKTDGGTQTRAILSVATRGRRSKAKRKIKGWYRNQVQLVNYTT
ncbi:A disintegrin and metalloproteinase withthrombospondin motifs 4 [Striga asiatica]|uniref:A disintegrin and metalloproteinase withthrombospondin motifs 4 n=1 Tax=Striga asiatica TaxID=4170 RepID=A0A5A7Q207_STRAF|nr:A disintegrin and metalloproteinase withthrombospondin motifs 4 [Striga asiatica]